VALGSVSRELSAAELGRLVSARHPDGRSVSASQVQRWEDAVEPDLESIRIMALMADVPFEAFALGVKKGSPGKPVGRPGAARKHA
jgi:hypothetical protein